MKEGFPYINSGVYTKSKHSELSRVKGNSFYFLVKTMKSLVIVSFNEGLQVRLVIKGVCDG